MIPRVTAIPELKMVRIDDGSGLTQIPVEFIRNRLSAYSVEDGDDEYEDDMSCDSDDKQWMVDVGNELSFGPMPSRSESDAFLQEVSNAMIHASSGKASYNV
jgi:hypothetical protein